MTAIGDSGDSRWMAPSQHGNWMISIGVCLHHHPGGTQQYDALVCDRAYGNLHHHSRHRALGAERLAEAARVEKRLRVRDHAARKKHATARKQGNCVISRDISQALVEELERPAANEVA